MIYRKTHRQTDKQSDRQRQGDKVIHMLYLKLAIDFSSGPFTTTPIAPEPLTANT